VSKDIVIALDEGTTNAKAVALDEQGNVVAKSSRPLSIQTPREGWVEQSGELLLQASLAVVREVVAQVGLSALPPWRSVISGKRL
jgi:glycerol kinase